MDEKKTPQPEQAAPETGKPLSDPVFRRLCAGADLTDFADTFL